MASIRFRRILALVSLVVVFSLAWAGSAQAAVSVARAEVSGDRLRIEGQAAAGRPITVDGVAMTTSSSSGSFRIERSGFSSPADCTVDVNDGTGAVSARLTGCTVTAPPAAAQPAAALAGVAVSPSTLQGGGSVSVTVTLTAPAPTGGTAVGLSSSNPAVVPVPAGVTVPAGATSWSTFADSRAVTASTTVTVTATAPGVTTSAPVTVTPPPPSSATLTGLTLSPSTVQTGTTQTSAILTFSALTPAGGATVALASSSSLATVPPSVTVPANSSTGAFPVTIGAGTGTATISATYQGVPRTAVLTVQAQTLFRIITESPLPNARVGENYAGFIEACCGQGTPYRWSLVNGTVPDGLRFAGDSLQLSRTTGVTGVATRVQTTTFTVRARDGAGNTATRTFTLTVDPAAPLTFNSPSQLTAGRVGASYFANLFAAGGVTPYRWTRVAGTLPPGLALQASPGRVQGTPTTAGTFTFTLRVDDSGGQSATGQFSIVINP